MKTLLAAIVTMGLLVSGCKKKPETRPTPPSSAPNNPSVSTAPAAPDAPPPPPPSAAPSADAKAPEVPAGAPAGINSDTWTKTLTQQDVDFWNYTIGQFRQDKGHNPADLSELVAAKYVARLPSPPSNQKLVYDAKSGMVSLSTK